jgi:hypothetical protein
MICSKKISDLTVVRSMNSYEPDMGCISFPTPMSKLKKKGMTIVLNVSVLQPDKQQEAVKWQSITKIVVSIGPRARLKR